MEIKTCYTVRLKKQLTVEIIKSGKKKAKKPVGVRVLGSGPVDEALMKATEAVCLEALKFCAGVFLEEWDLLKTFPVSGGEGVTTRKRKSDLLVHSTKQNKAAYPEFDRRFPNMPSYMRRAIIADALGIVSSHVSNHGNWEKLSPAERGEEPRMGYPGHYELTFYKQEWDNAFLDKGIVLFKLYNGSEWKWYAFQVRPSDAKFLCRLSSRREMLSPTVQKVRDGYEVRFCFEEKRKLVKDRPLDYVILAVDLGINAPATWCVMSSVGSVLAKGVIHLPCDEGRLNRMISRKRMYQQAGKKSRCVYRWVNAANRQLSIDTAGEIIRTAVLYDVDCIVFEHLDKSGRKKGRYKERLHMWRAAEVQKRVELHAHRNGMRISRVCAWGTSKLAFDGTGKTDRKSVYRLEHGVKHYNYSVCRFETGKIYNCDLSAAMNIGARFFLRAYAQKEKRLVLPKTTERTLNTLLLLVYNGLPLAA